MAPKAKTSMKAKPVSKGKFAKSLSKGKSAMKSSLKNQKATDTPWKKEQVAAQKKASYKEVTE
jgi:hypothetical protein